MKGITGGQAVVRCLESQGVEYAFGMAGHANLALLDALIDSNIKFVTVPHEQIAAHAADAYFRVTHKPAVVLTTVGPGATNTVAGLADALLDSSAMVVICGGIPSFYAGMGSFQEMDTHHDDEQFEIFKPITKRVWKVAHPRLLPHVLSTPSTRPDGQPRACHGPRTPGLLLLPDGLRPAGRSRPSRHHRQSAGRSVRGGARPPPSHGR